VGAPADLGAIVRACGATYLQSHRTTATQRKALRAISACRTPALGGQRQQCDRCGHEHIQWHSCRHRACPRCQASARTEWLAAREAELLAVPYFHVVFTVPEELNVLARHAPRVFYDLLFRAVGQTLTDVARSKLDVQIGALCVLHTWSQTLMLHPHIHCVVPGGGFSLDGRRWKSVRKPTFFLPVKVLSRRFCALFLSALREAWSSKTLVISPSVLADSVAFDLLLARACSKPWVVYAKPPFGGPAQVLAYLANYTHRIAISNGRIVAFDGQNVTFRWRDSANGNQQKLMTLAATEFLRRFLLHIIPSRLVRIRYYGFMANRFRTANIARARQLIPARDFVPPPPRELPVPRCPVCERGMMRIVARVDPAPRPVSYEDSS
jgi:Putative transposase/Transposase zinc-binding domain